MSEILETNWLNTVPQTDTECQLAIRAMFAEMDRMNAQMDRRRVEIDQLQAETRVMLDGIKRMTDELGQSRE